MKKKIYSIPFLAISLATFLLIVTSCEKEANKSAVGPAPVVTSTVTVQKYKLVNTHNTTNVSMVEDTLTMYTDGSVKKLTLPLNYNSRMDTMNISTTMMSSGQVSWYINHRVNYMSQYHLYGGVYQCYGPSSYAVYDSNHIYLNFSQNLSNGGPGVYAYSLTYIKINY
ncbi:MAG: hypothetical protein K0S44_1150 [Bacteroidetes bacterium]|jgi:hypothetical protein|nr:hypothetical protein [Bacteroidota bacterium]